jgi:hypothetical protein
MDTGVEIAARPVEPRTPAIDVKRPQQALPIVEAMREIAAARGGSLFDLIKDFAKLAFGPGRLSLDEYLAHRLFDDALYAGADKKAFVGLVASRKIWISANFRVEYFALVENKIAADALFAAYGFPTTRTLAVFANRIGLPAPGFLRDAAELRAFLTKTDKYPLFGKPLSGLQSLGSGSFDRYDAAGDCLVGIAGDRLPLDRYIADLAENYGDGYLFQARVTPHAAVRAICGDRLATARVLTIMSAGTPKLLRACWKIPAGANSADNFWRPGNLLAQLDLATGRVLRVVRGTGLKLEEITHHPDTGAALVGTAIPNWKEITDLALEGAKLVPDVRLIGWDIAPVDKGAVLVELNQTPDFILPQLADRRGILDETFKAFLAECRQQAAAWKRENKTLGRREPLSGFKIE